jgi:hypothetical protein
MPTTSTNEPNGDEEEIYNWHDLDDCMTAFIGRLSPLQRANNVDPEYVAAVDYYIALDSAICHGSRAELVLLLEQRRPIAPEFLPLLSNLLLGKNRKMGKPKHFTNAQELSMYRRMRKLYESEKTSLDSVFSTMCEEAKSAGKDVEEQTFKRIWRKCEANPWLKHVFGKKDQ